MILKTIDRLGAYVLKGIERMGLASLFLARSLQTLFTTRLRVGKTFYQAKAIGVDSFFVVLLTSTSIGSVLAYQSYIGLHRFGGEQFIGPVVFLSMVREFGPVLAAIMVTARAGSAMTAELGTMRISEQIDALTTLTIDGYQYLIVPRILGATFILPFLALFSSLWGIIGGYFIAVKTLDVNPELYMRSIRENVEAFDITSGLIKAVVFGFLLSWIATYKGYSTSGGAKGVGLATTQSVVYASVAIFVADYVLTALMF